MKMFIIGILIYILVLYILMKANQAYWDGYYKIFPEDEAINDELQIKALREYAQKKRARKARVKSFFSRM